MPAGAEAVAVVIETVRPAGGNGGLAVGPGGTEPTEPTVNFAPINANNAGVTMVPVDGSGRIAVNVTSTAGSPTSHIRMVIIGYLDDASGLTYVPVNPCAAFDSRTTVPGDVNVPTGNFAGPRIAGTSGSNLTGVTTYQVTGAIPAAQGGETDCGVPADAEAVLVNLVAIRPNTVGNYRAYASGSSPTGGVLLFRPLVPDMNNSNAVVVPLSATGRLDLFVNAPANDGNPTVEARGVVLGYYT